MTEAYKPLVRLKHLDSLRGLAALYVMIFHTFFVGAAPLHITAGLRQIVTFGGTGVFLFFVISGFSLSMTMPRHLATDRPLVSYAVSRIFRIVPLFYIVLAYVVGRSALAGTGLHPKSLLASLTFLFNFFPGKQEGIVPASWTIGVEMVFYALFPFIFAARLRTQILIFAAAQLAFVTMRYTVSPVYSYWSVVGWLPLFMIGMWTHVGLQRLGRLQGDKRALGGAMVAVAAVVLFLCSLPAESPHVVANRLPIALGYALLIVGIGLQRPGTLSVRPLLFLGRVSYSTYLLHALVILALDAILLRHLSTLPADIAFALRCAVVLAVVLPLAWAVTTFIETPIDKSGRRFGIWLQRRLPARHNAPVSKSYAQ